MAFEEALMKMMRMMRMVRMMRIVTTCSIAVGLTFVGLAVHARAQTASLPYDHMHLAAPDPVQAVQWYQKYFGGQPLPGEGTDRLMIGKTRFVFMKAQGAQPSAGSSIDHVGFSVPDLDAKMKQFAADGVKIVSPMQEPAGLFKLAFIEDPWGVKIEVVQDPETPGFHHIHLRAPNPDEVLTWYLEKFGGERAKLKNRIDAVKYGEVWLLVQRGDATPSQGHAIDHLGWRTPNLSRTFADLTGKGAKSTVEPREVTIGTTKVQISFVEGPSATRIEVVQR